MNKKICLSMTVYTLMIYLLCHSDWQTTKFILFGNIPSETVRKLRELKIDTCYSIYYTKLCEKISVSCGIEKIVYRFCRKLLLMIGHLYCIYLAKQGNNHVFGQDHSPYAKYFFDQDFIVIEDGIGNYRPYEEIKILSKGICACKYKGKEYIPFGWNEYVNEIYFTGRAVIPKGLLNKATIMNLVDIWNNLGEKKKKDIFYIFGVDIEKINRYISDGRDIFFLSGGYSEALKFDIDKEIEVYKKIFDKYDKKRIIIKKHPGESTKYAKFFPECAVIEDAFPFELLYFSGVPIKKIVSVNSTAAMGGLWDDSLIDTYPEYEIYFSKCAGLK